MLLNPKRGVREYPDAASQELALAVIDFFETKGLARGPDSSWQAPRRVEQPLQ